MALKDILEMLDGEVAKLRAARALLVPSLNGTDVAARRRPGRPRKDEGVSPVPVTRKKKRRNLSPEGRARIAAAARLRWAAKRKAAKE
jgi:hypothetical protein